MGMGSGAEAGVAGALDTEMGSEDGAGATTVEAPGLARGEELGTGAGEEAGPGSEDDTGRGEEMVKGAAPGADAVETEEEFARNSVLPPPVTLSCLFPYPKLHLKPSLSHQGSKIQGT